MVGFTDSDSVRTQLANGNTFHQCFWKQTDTTGGANADFARFWVTPGYPAPGAEPPTTPGEAYTNAVGSINFPDRAGTKKHLLSLQAMCNTQLGDTTTILYDRLVAVSQSIATTGSKTINSVALPRYTDGVGVECWVEIAVQNTGSPVLNLESYTSDLGALRSGEDITISSTIRGACFQIPLQAGDKGVVSVESIEVVTAVSGVTINVLLLKPIAYMGLLDVGPSARSFITETDHLYELTALPRIYDGASLIMMTSNLQTAVAGNVHGSVLVAYE